MYLKYFAFFLLVTLSVELFGLALRWMSLEYNHWIYNLYLLVHFFFYSWLYYRLLQSPLVRRVIGWSTGVFVAVYLANIWKGQGMNIFNSYSYLLASLLIVGWTLAYFQQLLLAREPLHLTREPTFWISTGVLFFNLCLFLYLGLLPYLLEVNPDWPQNFLPVFMVVNILTYSLFIVAFLCPKTQTMSPGR